MRPIFALAVLTASISTIVAAQTERDLDSHEHGSALLNVGIDDGSVFIELESPWNNLVGFEHAPSTEEQHALVDDAMARLNQPDQLFSFVGADCSVSETRLESTLGSDEHDDHDDDHHDDDAHGKEGHDDHDDDADGKEGHDDHDDNHHDDDADGDEHDHDDHSEEGETHSSVLATYNFSSCNGLENLVAIDVNLIKIWSGFEDLDVQLVGPGGQSAAELNQEEIRIDVTAVQ